MLFQTDYDPRDEGTLEKARSLQLMEDMKLLLLNIAPNIGVWSDGSGHSFLIHDKSLNITGDLCDYLDYLYPYDPDHFACYVRFELNNFLDIYGFGCIELTKSDLSELSLRLKDYNEVAKMIHCEVSLKIVFPD